MRLFSKIKNIYTGVFVMLAAMATTSCQTGLEYDDVPESYYTDVNLRSCWASSRALFEDCLFAKNYNGGKGEITSAIGNCSGSNIIILGKVIYISLPMNINYFANQFYNIFFISPSDKPDACMIVSIGTPRERRLDAIFTLASFSQHLNWGAVPFILNLRRERRSSRAMGRDIRISRLRGRIVSSRFRLSR